MEHSEELTKMFEGVKGAVEANRFEYSSLWKEYSKEYYISFKKTPDIVTVSWKENLLGLGKSIGEIAGRPIFLSLITAEIDGHKILFYDATSQVVDWNVVETWLKEKLPDDCPLTDANGFRGLIYDIQRKSEKAA